jgi:hypothetical protein
MLGDLSVGETALPPQSGLQAAWSDSITECDQHSLSRGQPEHCDRSERFAAGFHESSKSDSYQIRNISLTWEPSYGIEP